MEGITAEVITAEVITAEVITAEVINDEVITAEVITAEVITAEVINDEVITAEVINDEVITAKALATKALATKALAAKAVMPTRKRTMDETVDLFIKSKNELLLMRAKYLTILDTLEKMATTVNDGFIDEIFRAPIAAIKEKLESVTIQCKLVARVHSSPADDKKIIIAFN